MNPEIQRPYVSLLRYKVCLVLDSIAASIHGQPLGMQHLLFLRRWPKNPSNAEASL